MTIFPRKELGQIDDDDELHRSSQVILQELQGQEKKDNTSLYFLPIKLDKCVEILYLSFWTVWKCQLIIIDFECLF